MGRLVLVLFGYVVIGGPIVLFSWHELSEALLGRAHAGRLIAAFALLPVLLTVLGRLGRYLRTMEEAEESHVRGRRV